MKKWFLLLILPLFIITNTTYAVELPEAPSNGIYDPSHYLNDSVVETLGNTNKDNDTQIGVYIVDHIDSSIEETANKVARHWKIGYANSNRGILIAIAVKDRKLRIETSNEVSGDLPDVKAKQIIESIKPELRNNDYSGAVNKMITQINEKVHQKSENKKSDNEELTTGQKVALTIGFAMLIIGLIIADIEDKNRKDKDDNDHHAGSGDDSSKHRSRKPRINDDFATGLLLGSSFGSSYSSSGSSSNDSGWSGGSDWSGGGFDGGGSSGSW